MPGAAGVVQAYASGPGLLVRWPALADVHHFVLSVAREPSPSFYPLTSECCPLLPSLERPCCPVAGEATSLQVEGLEAGAYVRFRLIAVSAAGNATYGPSPAVRVPSVPSEPGALTAVEESPAIVSLAWDPPASDGGAGIVGYRLSNLATRAPGILLSNTTVAATAYRPLVLLPSRHYLLSAAAINLAGVGPTGAPSAFTTSEPARASYELSVGAWARGTLPRGGRARHRFWVPPASERVHIHVQQASELMTR